MKIIFSDIDGTLAEHGSVSASTVNACKKVRENGHKLFVCTGRPLSNIPDSILQIGFDGVVSSGGASISVGRENKKTLIFEACFPDALSRHIIEFLHETKTGFALELDDEIVANLYLDVFLKNILAKSKTAAKTAEAQKIEDKIMVFFKKFNFIDDERALWRKNIRKIVFMENELFSWEKIAAELSATCEVFHGSIPLFGSGGGEISPQGVHKGLAVEKVAHFYCAPISDTVAIGDSDNDTQMILNAGVGIAMGNATPELKAIADFVTDDIRNDGFAKALASQQLI
ncbi:MAG: Cof-type HAD-IIB family hydrolase [Treponemataceae bacterium]|nr:MAG: Cof-type HAD-IIB family hydrolase [Treponemataceae bacterium]